VTIGYAFVLPVAGHGTAPTLLLMLQDTNALLPAVALYSRVETVPAGTCVWIAPSEQDGGVYAEARRGATKAALQRMAAAITNGVSSWPQVKTCRLKLS
jgi:hypothetical protein